MALCSVCEKEVAENVNLEKVLICGECVQALLIASNESKIALRDKLLEKGDTEGAKSVESFITVEGDTDIPVFKTSCRKIGFKGYLGMVNMVGNVS